MLKTNCNKPQNKNLTKSCFLKRRLTVTKYWTFSSLPGRSQKFVAGGGGQNWGTGDRSPPAGSRRRALHGGGLGAKPPKAEDI